MKTLRFVNSRFPVNMYIDTVDDVNIVDGVTKNMHYQIFHICFIDRLNKNLQKLL